MWGYGYQLPSYACFIRDKAYGISPGSFTDIMDQLLWPTPFAIFLGSLSFEIFTLRSTLKLDLRKSDEEKYILAKGSWSIPFEFQLPIDGFESYVGKNVSIEYSIQALADLIWEENIVEETTFEVHYADSKHKTLTGKRWWEEHSGKKVKQDHADEILRNIAKECFFSPNLRNLLGIELIVLA